MLNLEVLETVFEVEQIALVMFHVLGVSWEELFPQDGRGSQQLPIINIPKLSQSMLRRGAALSHMFRRMDWGKASSLGSSPDLADLSANELALKDVLFEECRMGLVSPVE